MISFPIAVSSKSITIVEIFGNAANNYISKPIDAPSAAQMFTLFPTLPTELRLKIWEHAAFLPRNVDITELPCGRFHAISPSTSHKLTRYITTRCPPPMLHTNSESRAVGRRFYQLAFGSVSELEHGMQFSTLSRIYVNWYSDTILAASVPYQLMRPTMWSDLLCCRKADKFKIRRIALNSHAANSEAVFMIRSSLFDMPLDEITIYYLASAFNSNSGDFSCPLHEAHLGVDLIDFEDSDHSYAKTEASSLAQGIRRLYQQLEEDHKLFLQCTEDGKSLPSRLADVPLELLRRVISCPVIVTKDIRIKGNLANECLDAYVG